MRKGASAVVEAGQTRDEARDGAGRSNANSHACALEDERELAEILGALETDGRYRVERTLKDSPYETTQVVYRAGDPETGPFVRKVFANDAGRGAAYQAVFQAQAQGVRFAHQPFIYECTRHDDSASVVMEYVQGETLVQLVKRVGPSPALAVRVGIDLCDAMAELHEAVAPAIIHRDIKPSNIMISANRLLLMDLGIARTARPGAQRDTVRFGTPGYAPPEQFGYGQTSARSDVYAAGMVLAFCLTGDNPSASLREGGFDDARIPLSFRPVLAKATAFDPDARYQSARELGAAVQALAMGVPKPAKAPDKARNTANRTAKQQKSRSKASVRLGRAWNAVLLLAWAFLQVMVVASILDPQDPITRYPFWFNIFGNVTLFSIPSTCVLYLVMDRYDLHRRKPEWAGRKRWKEALTCAIVCLGLIGVMIIAGVVAGMVTGAGT